MIIKFFISIIISALISYFFTPLVRNFFIARSWVENPETKQKKTHNATAVSTLPRGGGLPVYFAILITSLIFLPPNRYLIGILLASLLTLIIGVWDDIKDISPKLRLFTNILSAFIVVGSGIGIAYISNPFGGIIDLSIIRINFSFFGPHSLWLISDLLAIFWIVWCMNITGWAAGVEGQLPGFVAISAIFIGILGLRFSGDTTQWPVIILAGAVAGSYLGFLPFNFFPQSIMPGYSGKSLAGFFLALLSILSGAKLATLLLLLGVPMIDAVFVIIRRLIHHKSLLKPDGQHLHHRLLKIGWSRSQIAVFYWLISLSLGFLSLFLNSQQKMYAFIGLFILFFGFLIQIYFKSPKDNT
jgi:UDP-GlcNAc:undecaprenyl-phosphate/decaprenyl-phosphate GlcNAc-1-phosphate transferase